MTCDCPHCTTKATFEFHLSARETIDRSAHVCEPHAQGLALAARRSRVSFSIDRLAVAARKRAARAA